MIPSGEHHEASEEGAQKLARILGEPAHGRRAGEPFGNERCGTSAQACEIAEGVCIPHLFEEQRGVITAEQGEIRGGEETGKLGIAAAVAGDGEAGRAGAHHFEHRGAEADVCAGGDHGLHQGVAAGVDGEVPGGDSIAELPSGDEAERFAADADDGNCVGMMTG